MSNFNVTYRLIDRDGETWAESTDADYAQEIAARCGLFMTEIVSYDPELVHEYAPEQEIVPCYEIDGEGCVSRYCTEHRPYKPDHDCNDHE